MQRYVAVLAFTLSAAAPALAAVVTTDQRVAAPSALGAAQPEAGAYVPIAPQVPPPGGVPQTPQPPVATAPVAPTTGPRPLSLPSGPMAVNIKLDLVLTDNFGGTPTKKTVSMVIMNRQSGMIRTQNVVAGHQVRLDVDATIEQHASGGSPAAPVGGGPITLRLTLQYTPAPSDAASSKGLDRGTSPAGLNESLAVILQDGKPLQVSQSADPVSDRRVTVEVTATVLK